MKKIKLTKIPSVLKNLNLKIGDECSFIPEIQPKEGSVIFVEVLEHKGKFNSFENSNGRLGFLYKGDVIPAVLGQRKALKEFSGYVPTELTVGETLSYICESGVISKLEGFNKYWGTPMEVKVLGSMIVDGKPMNIKSSAHSSIKSIPDLPIVVITGSTMDVGKTTMICKIVNHFAHQGFKVIGAKLTGVAYLQDIYKILDAGAQNYLSFLDAGLPSTCGSKENALSSAYYLLNKIADEKPDIVILEMGDGLLGKYHVKDILSDAEINKNIKVHINASSDICAVSACKQIANEIGLPIDLITGLVVNNEEGINVIKTEFDLEAESNQNDIPKAISIINNKILHK